MIYNPRSGTLFSASDEDPETQLRKLFTDRGVELEMQAFDCDALPALLQHAEETAIDAVVVCGGDGSILAVVKALGDRKLPLGIIRGGTMNILARDLGLPETLDAAADVIVGGKIRAIDVGFVNDEAFPCNSAIGLMPHLARTRGKLREVPWWRKWPTVLSQAISLIRTYPRLHVKIEKDGETRHFRTRAMAISNNPLADVQGPIPPAKRSTKEGLAYTSHATLRAGRWFGSPRA